MSERKGLFSKIETREDALKVIKDASIAFLFVAGITAALAFFVAPSMFVDAVLFAVLALILMKWKSRTAAIILLLLSLLVLGVTVANKMGVTTEGGTNIFLSVIIIIAAARATEATFKLHGRFREPAPLATGRL